MSNPFPPRFAHLSGTDPGLPREVVDTLQSPALLIFRERVRANLTGMKALLGGDLQRWRPHVKTAKIPEIFAEYRRFGVHRFKCATTRETRELLLACDATGTEAADILVAYPHVLPALDLLGELAREHPRHRLSVLCEDPDLVAAIPAELRIHVDLDPGMHRTGIPLDAEEQLFAVVRAAGERFAGIHFYEGHLHAADLGVREREAFALYAALLRTVGRLRAAGHPVTEIITSGTPAFPHALACPLLSGCGADHQISPGTVVYHDVRSAELLPQLDFLQPAALVLSRVISHPRADTYTLDAGSKALASELEGPPAEILGRPDDQPQTPSEEHLPVRTGGPLPARGSHLLLVPRHVCPTVNLAEEALLIDAGGRGEIVSVAARAHDLRTVHAPIRTRR